jgi:rhodanese-related sulfurtransferase
MSTAVRSIDDLIDEARRHLHRVGPREALAAQQRGALLVDIRPQVSRDSEGRLPGALVVDRNVLEWRFDPACDARLDIASYDLELILVCNEGYASSLAAASLQAIGIRRATDMTGGFRAWRALGLPVVSSYEPGVR